MREWFRKPLFWGVSVLLAALSIWLTGFLNTHLPGPERVTLFLQNVLLGDALPREDRFRIVLCWLEDDPHGDDTRYVAQAFTNVEGVTLVRSARIVVASGAADDWRETMEERARDVLEEWNADLAVVGLVKQSGATLSLWFVPRSGEGTLSRGDAPYELERATLWAGFSRRLAC